jgi:(p)ppGpp synthase/HD superfamily hydrolase
MNLIIKAAQVANRAHVGQIRKYTKKPYITHPSRVASRICLLDEATEVMVCAGWLHDTVEDTHISLQDIRDWFGHEVESLVWELTNPSKGKDLPRADRKEMDRKHLRVVSDAAKKIKLIDRIDNICEIQFGGSAWEKLYLQESGLLLDAIGSVDETLSSELKWYLNTYGRKFGLEF